MFYRRSIQLIVAASLCLFAGRTPVRADLVTDAGSIPLPQKVVDFSQFTGPFIFTSGPVQIGGKVGEKIFWSTTSPFSVIGDGDSLSVPYDLSPNGFWDDGRVGFTGLDVAFGTMTYTFNDGPVSAVGGFLNYAPDVMGDVIIAALDSSGNILASYDISRLAPISTPGQVDAGAFRGIVLPNADITAFQVSNCYVVLDDLTFSRTLSIVPEPSVFVLFAASALAGGVFLQRRGRRDRSLPCCSHC